MICPKCNVKSEEGTKFCPQCGEALPARDEFDSFQSPGTIASGGHPGTSIGGSPETISGMKTSFAQERIESTLKKGAVVAGRYEILNDGFKGGMGMVFKVKDNTLGKIKALKIILPQYLENEKAISRFKQEVAITQELVHENIVRVYDMGETAGALYFTMEWIEGISMRDYISERKKQNNRLSFDEVKNLIGQLCSALSYAHEKFQIVHRDIKPENLLMIDPYTKNPKIRIADFGIARTESQSIHHSVSAYMGTPIYMAPEQYTDASRADKRADIYSVGAILYELLTFMHPLGTFSMPTEVNPSLPQKVDEIVKKALSADKSKRYGDAMDIVRALDAPTSQEKTTAVHKVESKESEPRPSPQPQAVRQERKKSSMLIPVIVGVAVLVLAGVGYKFFLSSKGPEAPPAQQTSVAGSVVSPQASEIVKRGGGEEAGQAASPVPSSPAKVNEITTPAVKPPAQDEDAPLEMMVNLIGQRQIGNDDYEEVMVKNGSTLKSNDNFQVNVKTSKDCYVYVLLFDSEGKAGLLFPGMAGSNNRVTANKAYQIPAGNKWFFLDDKTGTESIYILVDEKPMADIDRLLADMERKGSQKQKEDSQKILTQVAVLKRGVGGISNGKPMAFKTSDGDTIQNVSQVVKGRGSLVWSVSFKHI